MTGDAVRDPGSCIACPVTCPLAHACTRSTIGIYDPVFHIKPFSNCQHFSVLVYTRVFFPHVGSAVPNMLKRLIRVSFACVLYLYSYTWCDLAGHIQQRLSFLIVASYPSSALHALRSRPAHRPATCSCSNIPIHKERTWWSSNTLNLALGG